MQVFEYIVRPIANKPLPSPTRPWHYRKPYVRGLGAVIKTYVNSQQFRRIGLQSSFDLVKGAGEKLMKAERTIWRYRPLSGGMKRYAALDIEMIWIVADTLKNHSSLTGTTLQRVKIGSSIYAAMRRDTDRKVEDVYICNPILASYVIPEVDYNGRIIPIPQGDTKCNGCRRFFESSHVTQNGLCEDCIEVVRVSKHRRN